MSSSNDLKYYEDGKQFPRKTIINYVSIDKLKTAIQLLSTIILIFMGMFIALVWYVKSNNVLNNTLHVLSTMCGG